MSAYESARNVTGIQMREKLRDGEREREIERKN